MRVSGNAKLDLNTIAFLMCRGGWPRAVDIEDRQIAIDQSYDYVDAVAESDLTRVDGIKKNAERVRRKGIRQTSRQSIFAAGIVGGYQGE